MKQFLGDESYPLFIHSAGSSYNNSITQQETMNRSEYTIIKDTKVNFLSFDQGDFSDWQSNTIQYYTSPDQNIAWYIYVAGSGKSGSIAGVTEHYKRWMDKMSESMVFDFIHGASNYINGAIILAPNSTIYDQQKKEVITLYSRKGDYPIGNASIQKSYGGTSDKGNERLITRELEKFYRFDTYTTFITNHIMNGFLPVAYKVQTDLYGERDRLELTREVVYNTIIDVEFISHCHVVYNNKILAIDEVTNMTPSGPGYRTMINEVIYAGTDEIKNMSHPEIYDDDIFLEQMGVYKLTKPSKGGKSSWAADKYRGNETSGFRTYFMFYHSIMHSKNMKLILASATPVQNPAKFESIAGQLNLFAAVLKVPPIMPYVEEILLFLNAYMGGSIGYIERIPSSLPKQYESSLSPLDMQYIKQGYHVETNIEAVIIPMGYFQAWKYFIVSNIGKGKRSSDKRDRISIGIMPTSGTHQWAEGEYGKVMLYDSQGYISGSKVSRGPSGQMMRKEPRQFSVFWTLNPVVKPIKQYFSNIDDLSLYVPKFAYIIQREEGHRLEAQQMFPNTATKFGLGVSVVYCKFVNEVVGLKAFGLTLELQKNDDKQLEYEMFNPILSASVIEDLIYTKNGITRVKKDKLQKKLRYLLFTSTTPDIIRRQAKQIISSPDNYDGSYIKMILLSETGREGITLGNGLRMYHLKSPSYQSHDTQLNARIVRAKVHEYIINIVKENGDDPSLLKVIITRLVSQFYPEVLNSEVIISPKVGSKQIRILKNIHDYYGKYKFYKMWDIFWKGLNRDEKDVLIKSGVMRKHEYEVERGGGIIYELHSVIKPAYMVSFDQINGVVGYSTKYITDEIRHQLSMDNTSLEFKLVMDTVKINTFDLQLNRNLNDSMKVKPLLPTEYDEKYDSVINREKIADILAAEVLLLTSSKSYIAYNDFVTHVHEKYHYCRNTINKSIMYLINNRIAQELNTNISYIMLYKGYIYLSTQIISKPKSLLSLTSTSILIPHTPKSISDYLSVNQVFKNNFLLDRSDHLVFSFSRLSRHDMMDIIESPSFDVLNKQTTTLSNERFLYFSRFWIHYQLPDIDVLRRKMSKNNWTTFISFSSRLPIREEVANRSSRNDSIIAHTFIPIKQLTRLPNRGYSNYIMNVHGSMRLYINGEWRNATNDETIMYKNYILERRRENVYQYERDGLVMLIKSSIINHKIAKEETFYRIKDPALEDIESSKLDKRVFQSGISIYSTSITDREIVNYLWNLNTPVNRKGRSDIEIEDDYAGWMMNIDNILAKYGMEYDSAVSHRYIALLSWLYKDSIQTYTGPTRRNLLLERLIDLEFLIDWDLPESFL